MGLTKGLMVLISPPWNSRLAVIRCIQMWAYQDVMPASADSPGELFWSACTHNRLATFVAGSASGSTASAFAPAHALFTPHNLQLKSGKVQKPIQSIATLLQSLGNLLCWLSSPDHTACCSSSLACKCSRHGHSTCVSGTHPLRPRSASSCQTSQ